MNTVLSFLFVLAVSSAQHVNYVAPVASGYIYRNDNNGPASLIQLGAVPYHQPQVFAPPLSLAQPLPLKLEAIKAYNLEPVPLPYVAAKPIVVDDSEDDDDNDDDSDESSEEYLDEGDIVENGGGSEYGEKHFAARGEKGSKGYNSKGHHSIGESGHYGKEHNEGFNNKVEGEKESHHGESDGHRKHYEKGDKYESGDQGHKKHSSKGEDITGYHKVFHKDEFKKDHDFYDVADNSGNFKKHSFGTEKNGYKKEGHKEGGHHNSASHKDGFDKNGYVSNDHVDEAALDHSSEEGQENHYKHHQNSGEKGVSGHEKQYTYGDHDDEDDD